MASSVTKKKLSPEDRTVVLADGTIVIWPERLWRIREKDGELPWQPDFPVRLLNCREKIEIINFEPVIVRSIRQMCSRFKKNYGYKYRTKTEIRSENKVFIVQRI